MLPNSPWDSSSGPAVKYREFVGPAAFRCRIAVPRDRRSKAPSSRRLQRAGVDERPARGRLVRVDPAIAEVAHEQIPAEGPEVIGDLRPAPRRVQISTARHATEEATAPVELVDEATSGAGGLVLRRGVLLRVRDEHGAADGLDAERRVAVREPRVGEGPRAPHAVEVAVEHVDRGVVEIGRVQEIALRGRGDREPLVDGTPTGGRHDRERLGGRARSRDLRVPAPNRAGLRREQEQGGAGVTAVADDEVAAVEDGAGRRAADPDDERNDRAGAVVEGREVRPVIRDPPRPLRASHEAPRVHEVGIVLGGLARHVGHELGHAVACPGRCGAGRGEEEKGKDGQQRDLRFSIRTSVRERAWRWGRPGASFRGWGPAGRAGHAFKAITRSPFAAVKSTPDARGGSSWPS